MKSLYTIFQGQVKVGVGQVKIESHLSYGASRCKSYRRALFNCYIVAQGTLNIYIAEREWSGMYTSLVLRIHYNTDSPINQLEP